MCAQGDHPPYDSPTPTAPRVYRLSGDVPEPRASVAVIVLAEMLSEAEDREYEHPLSERAAEAARVLREARNRVMAAEARL